MQNKWVQNRHIFVALMDVHPTQEGSKGSNHGMPDRATNRNDQPVRSCASSFHFHSNLSWLHIDDFRPILVIKSHSTDTRWIQMSPAIVAGWSHWTPSAADWWLHKKWSVNVDQLRMGMATLGLARNPAWNPVFDDGIYRNVLQPAIIYWNLHIGWMHLYEKVIIVSWNDRTPTGKMCVAS